MRRIELAIAVLLLLAAPAGAQSTPTGNVITVEQSIPFGTIPGKLLLLGNYLVFLDDQQPESSFVVSRSEIENLSAEGATITVQVREPVRDRSGSVNRVAFRATQPADAAIASAWFAKSGSRTSMAASTSNPSGPEPESYQASHDHFRGSCKGRLIVSAAQLSYESIDDVSHSRRWEYKAIKELALPNPYGLEIKPFTGGSYKFVLDGSGMNPASFKALVDRVTTARSSR